jgi:hypothetical protein
MSLPATAITPPVRPPADVRRKVAARLAEKFDPARLRHKPLSLVRADARRQADQLLDVEAPTLGRAERDRIAEDVLAALPGVGPLEELFRDEAVAEIVILATSQVVAYKAGGWVPTSARYRDADQVRAVLARYADTGDPTQPGPAAVGLIDVRLPHGFRVVAVLPPAVMDAPPVVHLTRGASVPPPPPGGRSDVIATPAPRGGRSGSGIVMRASRPTPPADDVVSLAAVAPPGPSVSGSMSSASGRLTAGPPSAANPDPFAKLKQRMTEKIIMRLASAGVYDLNQVPLPELRRFITLAVGEYCQQEGVESDAAFQQRLGLEILAGMNR